MAFSPITRFDDNRPYDIRDKSAPNVTVRGEKDVEVRRQPWRFENIWPLESLALLTSCACQIGLIVIISRMNNQPLDTWKTFISLNTMVSILSTLSKSLVLVPVASCISQLKWHHLRAPHKLDDFELFDLASRGPGGSALLALQFPFRLATLGAIITIVASAIGPFSQQIIRFETREVETPDNAVSFGFSHEYDQFKDFKSASGVIPASQFDYAMRGAFLKAVYGLESTPEFNCSSVCKWNGTYTTLGFDHECHNVTAATLSTKVCITDDGDEVDDYTSSISRNCNMTTPGNLTLTTRLSPTSEQTLQYVTSKTHMDWIQLGAPGDYFNRTRNPEFLRVAQYMAQDNVNNAKGYYDSNITECTVSVAAWELSGVSANGSTFTISNRTKIALGRTLPQSNDSLPEPFGYGRDSVEFSGPGIPRLVMGVFDWTSIGAYMSSQLLNLTSLGGEPTIKQEEGSPIFTTEKYGTIDDILGRVTKSMTDSIRSASNNQLAYGTVVQSVVFVQIAWLWYLLPLTVEIGTLILLACTMWGSRRGTELPLWKSSALALLSHDMEETGNSTGALGVTTKLSNTIELDAMAQTVAYLKLREQ